MVIILSIAIGLLMGVIGGGGGGIYVVIVMIFMHQSVKTAVGTALILSTITLSGAAFQYALKKEIERDYFILISIFGVLGTLLGSLFMKYIDENILKIAIVCVFVLSGLSSLIKIKLNKDNGNKHIKASSRMYIVAPLGIASGLITGALGLSGGTVLSSFLVGLLDFSPYMAVGTTTMITLVLNLTGAIFHAGTYHINMKILLILGIGSALGALFGAKLASRINRKLLTILLSGAAILSGIYLALK